MHRATLIKLLILVTILIYNELHVNIFGDCYITYQAHFAQQTLSPMVTVVGLPQATPTEAWSLTLLAAPKVITLSSRLEI